MRLCALLAMSLLFTGCAATIENMSKRELRSTQESSYAAQNFTRTGAASDEILRRQPEDYEAMMVRGLSFMEQGQHSMALDAFQNAANLRPERALPHVYSADLNVRLNRLAAARTNLMAVSRYDMELEEEAIYFLVVGNLAMLEGDHLAAADSYDRAVASATASASFELEPVRQQALRGKAAAAFEQADYPAGFSYYNAYVNARGEQGYGLSAEDHYWLAFFAFQTNRYDVARQHGSMLAPDARQRLAESVNDSTFFN